MSHVILDKCFLNSMWFVDQLETLGDELLSDRVTYDPIADSSQNICSMDDFKTLDYKMENHEV